MQRCGRNKGGGDLEQGKRDSEREEENAEQRPLVQRNALRRRLRSLEQKSRRKRRQSYAVYFIVLAAEFCRRCEQLWSRDR